MCECVNIQYKRLEQLSGASPQTQPGFGFQLAAGGFRGPERHWWGGGSPALHSSFTSPPEPCWEPHQPPPASPGPLQLAAFLPSQVQQECWSQIVWVMAVSEGTGRNTRLSHSRVSSPRPAYWLHALPLPRPLLGLLSLAEVFIPRYAKICIFT